MKKAYLEQYSDVRFGQALHNLNPVDEVLTTLSEGNGFEPSEILKKDAQMKKIIYLLGLIAFCSHANPPEKCDKCITDFRRCLTKTVHCPEKNINHECNGEKTLTEAQTPCFEELDKCTKENKCE